MKTWNVRTHFSLGKSPRQRNHFSADGCSPFTNKSMRRTEVTTAPLTRIRISALLALLGRVLLTERVCIPLQYAVFFIFASPEEVRFPWTAWGRRPLKNSIVYRFPVLLMPQIRMIRCSAESASNEAFLAAGWPGCFDGCKFLNSSPAS